jgi:FKBP-type peptidyl-prolyl cis-trans isomerase
MNKTILSASLLLAFGATGSLAADIKSADDLKDARQKASYGLGVNAGNMWKNRGADIDWDAYMRGVRDSQAGSSNLLSDAQIREAMQQFQTDTQARFQAKQAADGAKNKEAGEKFLAENKGKEGVKTTESGLQYKVAKMGDGPKPAATDRVSVHYTGTLVDGKKFDSSIDRGQPAKFALNGVIKGWTEGLQLMPVGSKFQFFIPPDLAYGANAPASIGPSQVLIFDVELLAVEPPAAPPAGSPAGAAAGQPVTSDIIKVPSADELKKGAKIEVIKADEAQKLIEKEKAKQLQEKKP